MATRPEESLDNMIAALEGKTGKTLDAWFEIIRARELARHSEMMALLKGEHGVSHGYANQIALRFLKQSGPEEDDPIEAMFTGSKAGARPIYDLVLAKVKSFGSDVDLAPKKGYLSVRRKKQFAILQPAANRLDVGINLKDVAPVGRLEPSGSFNAMLSHRVKVAGVGEVDEELVEWLRSAYEQA